MCERGWSLWGEGCGEQKEASFLMKKKKLTEVQVHRWHLDRLLMGCNRPKSCCVTPFSSDRQIKRYCPVMSAAWLFSWRDDFSLVNRKHEVEDAYMSSVYMSIMYDCLTEACILFSWAFSTSYLWCSALTEFSKNPLSSLNLKKKITVLSVIPSLNYTVCEIQ